MKDEKHTMGERPNLKLSEETGKETREALNKYKTAFNLDNQEEAIRTLLPEWAFNPLITGKMGRLEELVDNSRHLELDFSQINDIDQLSEIADEVEDVAPELATEMKDVIQAHSSKANSE